MLKRINLLCVLLFSIMFVCPAMAAESWIESWFPWAQVESDSGQSNTGVGVGGGHQSIPDPN